MLPLPRNDPDKNSRAIVVRDTTPNTNGKKPVHDRTIQIAVTAQEMLHGYSIKRGTWKQFPIAIFSGPGGDEMIAIHRSPVLLQPYLHPYKDDHGKIEHTQVGGLFALFDYFNMFTKEVGARRVKLLNRSLHQHNRLLRQKKVVMAQKLPTPEYQEFLDIMWDWALPPTLPTRYNELWIIGHTSGMFPTAEYGRGTLGGNIIAHHEGGDALRALLCNTPSVLRTVPRLNGHMLHIEHAAPTSYLRAPNYLLLSDQEVALYRGNIDGHNITQLLHGPYNTLLQLEQISKDEVVAFPLVMVHLPLQESDQLVAISEDLRELGLNQIVGEDQDLGLSCFMPGGPPVPDKWCTGTVEDLDSVLRAYVDALETIGDPDGDTPLGPSGHQQLFKINRQKRPVKVVTGTTKDDGKTTTETAQQYGLGDPYTIATNFSASPNDGVRHFLLKITGNLFPDPTPEQKLLQQQVVWDLGFLDVHQIVAKLKAQGKEIPDRNYEDWENELCEEAAAAGEERARKLVASFHVYNRVVGVPMMLNPIENSVANIACIVKFHETMLEEIPHWFALSKEVIWCQLDNWSFLLTMAKKDHPSYGNIPFNWAYRMAQVTLALISHGANNGYVASSVITHVIKDFVALFADLAAHFPIEQRMDASHTAHVYYPREDPDAVVAKVNCSLPIKVITDWIPRPDIRVSSNNPDSILR